MWQGWKPLNMPFREAKIIPKNWKFLQLAVLHLSAFQELGPFFSRRDASRVLFLSQRFFFADLALLGNGKDTSNESAEISHGSFAPLWLHQSFVKQVFGVFFAVKRRNDWTLITYWLHLQLIGLSSPCPVEKEVPTKILECFQQHPPELCSENPWHTFLQIDQANKKAEPSFSALFDVCRLQCWHGNGSVTLSQEA